MLLYSTCTILPRENEAVVNAFLAKHPEFAPVPMELPHQLPDGGERDGHAFAVPSRLRRIFYCETEEAVMKQDIKSLTLEELTASMGAMGQPAFRAKQVFSLAPQGRCDL